MNSIIIRDFSKGGRIEPPLPTIGSQKSPTLVGLKEIYVSNAAAAIANANNIGKKVIFENCALFIDFTSKINNAQVDNAKDIDILMPMYNLTEYSDNYSETTGSLWQL